MTQVINTNTASLNAQRNLGKSQMALATSLQRLSSGLRINSARDDAAGLAISQRFTAQINGLNQAVRNSNDGISLAQTAEGALGEVTNNLQRIRELSVQSANATNSSSDRAAMQQEVSQLVSEIDRVATQTNFNGINLLDGSFSGKTFQVGANVGDTIGLSSIVNATRAGLGLDNGTATVTGSAVTGTALAAGDLTINGKDVGAVASNTASNVAAAIHAADNSVTATASTSVAVTFAPDAGASFPWSYTMNVNGVDITYDTTFAGGITSANMDGALSSATASLNAAGISYTGNFSGGNLVFTDATGSDITISEFSPFTSAHLTAGVGTTHGTVTLSQTGKDLVIGGNNSGKAGLTAGTTQATGNTLDVSTLGGANAMISAVDTALGTVNGARATLGAVQNRFASVVTSLQTSSESMTAARSRIEDTDFASETANLTRQQILQQAGTAMLAQANQLPQSVLALLR